MDKAHILAEIIRTAAENDGVALGRERFLQETGIKESDWIGKIWARWGDAVKEAGVKPNQMQTSVPEDVLIEKLIALIRELGRFPVVTELKLKARQDEYFPSHNTFRRFGGKIQQIKKIAEYCEGKDEHLDILQVIAEIRFEPTSEISSSKNEKVTELNGFVYLLKSGRHFKIGRSKSFERRSRELAIQLPEKAQTIHVIRTDDPSGIEHYWHRRFESKRKNGEWFELTTEDVKAFKRRKFM
jgi:Meiotically up-regulated gene 113